MRVGPSPAACLATAACPLTGQVLSVRGGPVAVDHGWPRGAHIHEDGLRTVAELAEQVRGLPVDDPFGKLADALGSALGPTGHTLQQMIDALLDRGER